MSDEANTPGQRLWPASRRKFSEGLVDEDLILEALGIQPGQTVLDAGCGTGYMARAFSVRVASAGLVYALDRDQHFIGRLSDETRGSNLRTMVGDMSKPSAIPEHSVDVVYASTVVWLLARPQLSGFIEEAKRLLKPRGLLAIVEMDKKETPYGPAVEQRYSPIELQERIPLTPWKTIKVGADFYMQVFINS